MVMVFVTFQHELATGTHVPPSLSPPPTSLLTPTLWVVPEHWLWVPCFMHQLALVICFTYDNIHVSMVFSQIIPPSPSSTESKHLFFISVSLLLSHLSVQVSSIAQSCPTLCNPMNCSTPGLPVHHQLPEFTQTHVHRVGDAIQPSHPLSSPSPPASNPSQHQSLLQ